MSEHSPFLSVFPGCEDLKNYAGGLEKAYVTDVQVDAAEMTLTVCAWFSAMPSPVEVTGLTERLKADYGLSGAGLIPDFPRPRMASTAAAVHTAPSGAGAPPKGRCALWPGHKAAARAHEHHLSGIGQGHRRGGSGGRHQPQGLQKRGSAVLCFDVTDRTNSVRVSRFLRSEDDQSVIDKIAEGDHVVVQGEIIYSKYDDDMVLDPRSIMKGKRYIRPDEAPEKRVELHMHTRFSGAGRADGPGGHRQAGRLLGHARHRRHGPRRGPGLPGHVEGGEKARGQDHLRPGVLFCKRHGRQQRRHRQEQAAPGHGVCGL